MLRNALRKELAVLLAAPPESRPPVSRRSREQAWIYATDLPALYGCAVPEKVTKALKDEGWEYIQEGGWLQLRKPEPEPPADWYAGSFGPEAACCRSLLKRHEDSLYGPADEAQRMLIKAGEEGEKAYEEACGKLHREWAARLRKGEPLPAVSRRYFGG